ncbi:metalloregulator ArsR/SmtB family transcription factor [bacterium]|nr:metalloregulator ArsR/SmtB family transcription factor [bacterium]
MDLIFKALSDGTRRTLIDALRERDGQTLTELESGLGMTRFGVMKHLKILEASSLVVSRKVGRFRYHYLNAAPLQQVIDRWIEPVVQKPMARVALNLKAKLEGEPQMPTKLLEKPDFVLETYIRTTPELLWQALTTEAISARYNILAGGIQGEFTPGGRYRHVLPNGASILSGEVIDAVEPKRLELTFVPGWAGPDAKPSRCVYEIEAVGEACRLTVLHFDIPPEQEGVREGWAKIISNLKTMLETGEPLRLQAD